MAEKKADARLAGTSLNPIDKVKFAVAEKLVLAKIREALGALVEAGTRGHRCPDCARVHDKARGTRQERGYGRGHELTREALLPEAYGTPCRYCGNRMWPHERLALDHTADRTGYRGIVHADYRDCPAGGNAAEGARRGNADRISPYA